jgi:ribosomal protein S17
VFLVVISLDRDNRDAIILQELQSLDRVVHRFWRNAAFVKKVTAHQHKVDSLGDRVSLKHIHPRVKKIAWTFGKLISRAS